MRFNLRFIWIEPPETSHQRDHGDYQMIPGLAAPSLVSVICSRTHESFRSICFHAVGLDGLERRRLMEEKELKFGDIDVVRGLVSASETSHIVHVVGEMAHIHPVADAHGVGLVFR